jgi:hypothetical protein
MAINLPAIPEPSAVDIAAVRPFCEQLTLWAQTVEDAEALNDAKDRLTAIRDYMRKRSTEGQQDLNAALRRIEVRIGQLLPPPRRHSKVPTGGIIAKNQATAARKMAQSPEIVEQVIAESTDIDPPTRKKVMAAIDPKPAAPAPALREVAVRLTLEDFGRAQQLSLAAGHNEVADWVGHLIQAALRSGRRTLSIAPGVVTGLSSHEHVAGKALPSGINPCSVAGCVARTVLGRWVYP